jgi:hypothetical protein
LKKKSLTAIAILTLLLLPFGVQFVEVAKANFSTPFLYPLPYLTIDIPTNNSFQRGDVFFNTRTYTVRHENVDNISISETIKWVNYSLDGNQPQSLDWEQNFGYYGECVLYTNTVLKGLSKGSHFINVTGETTFNSSLSSIVNFTVLDSSQILPITFDAHLIYTHTKVNLEENISVGVIASGGKQPYIYEWYIDNQLVGKTTIGSFHSYSANALTVGSHLVYALVVDAHANSGKTDIVNFEVLSNHSYTIPTPSPTTAQFSLTPLHIKFLTITAIVIIFLTITGLHRIFYRRKQLRDRKS